MNLQIIRNSVASDILDEEEGKSNLYYTLHKYYARFTQFLAWPIAFVYFHFFFRLKITGKENLRGLSSPFILVSNHIAYYDSFVLRLVFGVFTMKLPLRLMAVKRFNSKVMNFLATIGIIDLVYLLFGVFVIVPGKGMKKNLEEAIGIVRNGGNVVMYPEGSIMSGGIGEFKKGAAVLTNKTGAPVLPISMRIGRARFFRKNYYINIGEVIHADERISSIELTHIFRKTIEELYRKR